MTIEELNNVLRENQEALFTLRLQTATGQLEDQTRRRRQKREIARIFTVLRERKTETKASPQITEEKG